MRSVEGEALKIKYSRLLVLIVSFLIATGYLCLFDTHEVRAGSEPGLKQIWYKARGTEGWVLAQNNTGQHITSFEGSLVVYSGKLIRNQLSIDNEPWLNGQGTEWHWLELEGYVKNPARYDPKSPEGGYYEYIPAFGGRTFIKENLSPGTAFFKTANLRVIIEADGQKADYHDNWENPIDGYKYIHMNSPPSSEYVHLRIRMAAVDAKKPITFTLGPQHHSDRKITPYWKNETLTWHSEMFTALPLPEIAKQVSIDYESNKLTISPMPYGVNLDEYEFGPGGVKNKTLGVGTHYIGDWSGDIYIREKTVPFGRLKIGSILPAPTGLAVTRRTPTTASLKWDPPKNTTGVKGYEIFRRPVEIDGRFGTNIFRIFSYISFINEGDKVGSVIDPNFTDQGLAFDTHYQYHVKTVLNNGTSNFSGPASTVDAPREGYPPVPAGLKVASRTEKLVSLQWGVPAGGGVKEYVVYRKREESGVIIILESMSVYEIGRSRSRSPGGKPRIRQLPHCRWIYPRLGRSVPPDLWVSRRDSRVIRSRSGLLILSPYPP